MNRRTARTISTLTLGGCLAVCVLGGTLPANAADSDREERWQFSIPITWTSSETIEGQNGSSVDVAGDASWGFGFGYNLRERWFLGLDFTFMEASFDATVVQDNDPPDGTPDGTSRISGRLDSSSFQITGQYNFLEKTITPFVRGSLGSTYVDSNIAAGPPQGFCWWLPYWGYVCDSYVPTFSDTSFSYGAGVGVRGELNDRFYLEASANQLWIDLDRAETVDFTGYRLTMGWMF